MSCRMPAETVARKFLYIVAGAVVLVLVALLVLRIFADELSSMAFVPTEKFSRSRPLADNAYASMDMWISRPGLGENDPARWLPKGVERDGESLGAAVFFIHPTSYFEKARWNASLTDAESRKLATRWVREMASAFNESPDVWAPRYRQATFGAFLTDKPDADRAIDTAYRDVAQAFGFFLATIDGKRPIVLAGHSQGAYLLARLIRDRIKGTPLKRRIAVAYVVGWPLSRAQDLPALGMPACKTDTQTGCLVSWTSFAEPADTAPVRKAAAKRGWLDGTKGEGTPIVCVNPLTGTTAGKADAAMNHGTLLHDDRTGSASLVNGMIPARCGKDGFLYVGPPPDLGKWVMPGNNYHVYDIPMFWMNLREDVSRRVTAWQEAH
jgi:hypothetical protein